MTDDELLADAMQTIQAYVLAANHPHAFLDALIRDLTSKQLPAPCPN